jgi:hypothetical protein
VSSINVSRRAVVIGLVIAALSAVWLGSLSGEAAGRGLRRPFGSRTSASHGQGHAGGELRETREPVEAASHDEKTLAVETKIETGGEPDCCGDDFWPDDEPWLRGDDGVYLVDTRCLGCPSGKRVPELPIYRYDVESAAWQSSSAGDLADDCLGAVASIHIHGNRIDRYRSVSRGWSIYHEFLRRDRSDTRLVFIIWSWPSDKIRGPMRDVRTKAARTTAESYFLAHLISALPPDTPVSLTGHSFGARIICGGAHLLAGGHLGRYALGPDGVALPRELSVVLSAAAMHDYWLSPGCYHGRALWEIDRLLVLYNTCDPVLKYYRHIERGARPRALGYSGAAICGDTTAQVDQLNVACQIGKEHSFFAYLSNPTVMDLVAPYALFQAVDLPQ